MPPVCRLARSTAARKTLAEEKGEAALRPYNTGYSLAGDVEKVRPRLRGAERLEWVALTPALLTCCTRAPPPLPMPPAPCLPPAEDRPLHAF